MSRRRKKGKKQSRRRINAIHANIVKYKGTKAIVQTKVLPSPPVNIPDLPSNQDENTPWILDGFTGKFMHIPGLESLGLVQKFDSATNEEVKNDTEKVKFLLEEYHTTILDAKMKGVLFEDFVKISEKIKERILQEITQSE